MDIQLLINGSLSLTILDKKTNEQVSEAKTTEIFEKLKSSHYFIGLTSKTIVDGDLNIIYHFDFNVNDDTEYDFENGDNI